VALAGCSYTQYVSYVSLTVFVRGETTKEKRSRKSSSHSLSPLFPNVVYAIFLNLRFIVLQLLIVLLKFQFDKTMDLANSKLVKVKRATKYLNAMRLPLSGWMRLAPAPFVPRWKIPRIVRRVLSRGQPSRCYHWKMATLLRGECAQPRDLMRYFARQESLSALISRITILALITKFVPSSNRNFRTPRPLKTRGPFLTTQ